MEKEKNILQGVTLLFCINIITSFFTQLIEISVCKFSVSIYLVLPINLAMYAAILYIIFGKDRKFPEISILIFAAIFVLRSISQNLGMFFNTHEDLVQIASIESLNRVSGLIYSLIFAGLAYKYYKQKINEESEDAYIYYGMILFIVTYNAVSAIAQLLLLVSRFICTPYFVAIVVAICCITLFVYLFLKFAKDKPTIHPLLMFVIIAAGSLSPLLLKVGDFRSTYNDNIGYSYVFGFLSIISGFTYILIAIISYIKYYNLWKTGTSRLGIISLLTIVFVFLITIATNYASISLWQNKSSNESFNKMKAEIPPVITDHMPGNAGLQSKASYSGDNYTSLITYLEGSSAMKRCREMLSRGYIGKYEANDPHLVCLSTYRIEAKLKAEKITYSTFDINGVMYYPVPEFGFDDNSSVELDLCGLPSDFTIYIIEAKPEKLRERSSLASIMPQGWKNGYTKGVCISKKRNAVIYWGAAW